MLSSLGLTGIFAGVFLEAVGLPFPGSLVVALAGFLAKQGEFSIVAAWLAALAGYMLGSLTAFLLGGYLGEAFLEQWGRYIRLTPERIDKAQELLQRSAPAYVIVGRFLPTIGNITPYVAGISGISLARFLLYDMIHAIIWLTVFFEAGAALGSNWHSWVNSPWFKWGAAGGGVVILVYMFWDVLFAHSKNRI